MAKKKKAAKKKATAKKKTTRKPRQQVFDGMQQVRNTTLDSACESIGDVRDKINRLKEEEGDELRAALKVMRDHDLTSYHHAGLRLLRSPGEEKLVVRKFKEEATAETESAGDASGEATE